MLVKLKVLESPPAHHIWLFSTQPIVFLLHITVLIESFLEDAYMKQSRRIETK